MKNVGIISLGCPKNTVDSEKMIGILKEKGYNIVSEESKADILIINTCGFIEEAKRESIQYIIEMGKLKNRRLKYLIATGCLSERYNKELLKELPELDAVIGTGDFTKIAEVIEEVEKGKIVLEYGHANLLKDEGIKRVLSTPHYYAYLKIAEGCSNSCSFCIIPKLRGRYKSRKMEDIIEEAQDLAKIGVKELILIAQDTTKYGIDIYKQFMLPQLLRELSQIEGLKWIRLLYAYPDSVTDELVEEMRANEKVVKYIDIPLQHSHNDVLKRMNRNTNRQKIEEVINKLRSIPGMVIRTTFIVGFPGETEEEFEDLKQFIKDKKFERVGVFIYSREEGTKSYNMKPQIKKSVKIKRQQEIMEIQKDISYQNNLSKIGTQLEVLIEGYEDGIYYGRSYMDAPEIDGNVYVKSDKKLMPGHFVTVTVTDAYEYDLVGEC
ncbi:ribosomal protein S12 methylthiotransferase RimO [Thermoanaerobacter kivui]|uniref:Ribosomal protein uS12 methylthiotransferase RimO n=1 Tax=Thermoanaerobacter kivui TaxID=2325 RepID=A0A097ARL0_THEKI|nr:30S ribosomal protein S12 methylthiotransferase RimO [Thermoanaerobacter kivui]AIS52466.1 ribosomal protein S12 methylthiotransferase RimO [Thermoanaerobacter kivui]